MIKSLSPCNDRVLIKPIKEEKKVGSILIADLGQEKPEIGEVIAIGPGRKSEFGTDIGVHVKVGDIVLVPKIGTLRVEVEGEEYYMCPDKEILAVVDYEK